jgi:hypothetical protein
MINLRFKNPYKIDKEIAEEHFENDGSNFDFGDIRIYEFDNNNELAPKGNIILFSKNMGKGIRNPGD